MQWRHACWRSASCSSWTLAVVMVACAACSEGTSGDGAATTSAVPTSSSLPSATSSLAPATTVAPAPSPTPQPAPPSPPPTESEPSVRLQAQVTAFGGGGDIIGCGLITELDFMLSGGEEVEPVVPSVSFSSQVSPSTIRFGDWVQLCVLGFEEADATYELQGPNGFVRQGTIAVTSSLPDQTGTEPATFGADGDEVPAEARSVSLSTADGPVDTLILSSQPAWMAADVPPGAYTLTVVQGETSITSEVELVPASRRYAVTVARDDGTLDVVVTGPPGTPMQVGLYEGFDGSGFEFELTLDRVLGEVTPDERGVATLSIDPAELEPGGYCIVVEDDDVLYCPSASVQVA